MMMNDAAESSDTRLQNITPEITAILSGTPKSQTRKITDEEQVKIWKEVAMM
jgi:hypothetical protein